MTEQDRYEAAPLPGLELDETPADDVEKAARRTLAALRAEQLLDERDAVLCQSLVSVARAYDRAMSSGAKAYAVAQVHAQLLATIEQLPKPDGGDEDDPWMKALREEAERQAREAEVRGA